MFKNKKNWLLILIATFAISTLFATGCSKKEEPEEQATAEQAEPAGESAEAEETATGEDNGITIGVSLLKENDDFYISLKGGLADAAAAAGLNIEILSADSDEEKQSKNVDALLAKGINVLVICPVNSKGVGNIIQKATDQAIPAFTADIAAETGDVVAHVASDNYMGGQLAAERMAEIIGEGKVAIVLIPGTESVAQRVGGFTDKAKELGLTVLEPHLNGKDDVQESERAVSSVITQNADLAGVFAANDNMAMGALVAIEASGQKIILIGYDAAPAAQAKIKEGGLWKADVIQYPSKIGAKTIETIQNYINGKLEPVEEGFVTISVEVGLFDANTP